MELKCRTSSKIKLHLIVTQNQYIWRTFRDKNRPDFFNHSAIQVGEHYYHLEGTRFRRDFIENVEAIRAQRKVGTTLYSSKEIMSIGESLGTDLSSAEFVNKLLEVLTGTFQNYGVENFIHVPAPLPPSPPSPRCKIL